MDHEFTLGGVNKELTFTSKLLLWKFAARKITLDISMNRVNAFFLIIKQLHVTYTP
jgi:hypothetical protein